MKKIFYWTGKILRLLGVFARFLYVYRKLGRLQTRKSREKDPYRRRQLELEIIRMTSNYSKQLDRLHQFN
jgi:hypothetical protein